MTGPGGATRTCRASPTPTRARCRWWSTRAARARPDGLLACFITGRAVERYGRLELGARQAAVRETLTRMFGPGAGDWTAYAECDWTAEPYSRGGPVGLMGPGTLGTIRPRPATPCGAGALGRHRHGDCMERLHGRCDPGRRACCGRGAGNPSDLISSALRAAALGAAFPSSRLEVISPAMSSPPPQPAAGGQPGEGPTPEAILQLGTAFWASKTLLSAVELGLFTELARSGPLPRRRCATA